MRDSTGFPLELKSLAILLGYIKRKTSVLVKSWFNLYVDSIPHVSPLGLEKIKHTYSRWLDINVIGLIPNNSLRLNTVGRKKLISCENGGIIGPHLIHTSLAQIQLQYMNLANTHKRRGESLNSSFNFAHPFTKCVSDSERVISEWNSVSSIGLACLLSIKYMVLALCAVSGI